jgi:hypothetical protein
LRKNDQGNHIINDGRRNNQLTDRPKNSLEKIEQTAASVSVEERDLCLHFACCVNLLS